MAMVMPRAFSSGALSIWSNGVKATFGLCSCSTLVIAAVSVVLPWSMCPIVPTLTWGFVRSNFCLPIVADDSVFSGAAPGGHTRSGLHCCRKDCCPFGPQRLLAGRPGDDLAGDRL